MGTTGKGPFITYYVQSQGAYIVLLNWWLQILYYAAKDRHGDSQGLFLQIWINFNPNMDK